MPLANKSDEIIILELFAWFITFSRDDWLKEPWITKGWNWDSLSVI
jgi:hypothetical protein